MVTKNDVKSLLASLGIKPDDTVMVHSSMRSIGGVDGGCDALIDAFTEYLCDGLFIVPAHTWDKINAENPHFDVRTSEPCTGALTSVASKRNDGIRSLHPTHSVVAFGKRAKEYVKGEEMSGTPAPVGGCWSRLYDENAKIILLGVGHERNTFIHAVDEMIDLPDRISDNPFEAIVTDYDGNVTKTIFRHHAGAISDYFVNFKKPFDDLGAVIYGNLGNALVYCCDAVKMTHILKHIWQKTDHDLCKQYEEIPVEWYCDFKYEE